MSYLDISTFNNFKKLIKNKKFKKIFIISGKKSFYNSGAYNLLKFPKEKILEYYFKKQKLPEYPELVTILNLVNKFKPDVIVAIGVGAVIDYAKIVSVTDLKLTDNLKKKLTSYKNLGVKKVYPLIAIPTTAGSGAEVTSNSVIYVDKVKYSVENRLLIPNYYFLIPSLVINNPKVLKSSAGFDAIAQSVESLISIKSNKTSCMYAKKSLSLSLHNYLSFLKNPNLENSTKMLLSSNLSGKAINISKTTAPHAISYPFSSMFGINHGHAVSLTFEKFLTFNYKNLHKSRSNFDLNKRYQIIFQLFKVKNIVELNQKIKFLKKEANLIDSYLKLGINLKTNIENILNQVNILRLKNNPIIINKEDIRDILND